MTDLLTRPTGAGPTTAAPAAPAPVEPSAVELAPAETAGAPAPRVAPWPWARLALATTARAALLALTCLALWGAVPALLGWHTTTVVTGSMEPKIAVGDVAVSMPVVAEALVPGRVLLFDDPDHPDRLRFHRLASFDEQGLLVTRGDANDADDSTHVDPARVHGVGVLKVPAIGLPVVWWHERRLPLVALTVLALGALLALSRLDRDLHPDDPADRPGAGGDGAEGAGGDGGEAGVLDSARPGPARRAAGRPGRAAAGVLPRRALAPLPAPARPRARRLLTPTVAGAVALVSVLGVSGTAWSALGDETASPTGQLAAARYYRCGSAVLADSPYLFHQLDETPSPGGTVTNAVGGNRNGVYRNSATSSAPACAGDSGRSVTLNGTSQYISSTAETVSNPTAFTLEAWVRTGSRQGRIIGFGNVRVEQSSQYDRHLYVNGSGRLVFGVYTTTHKTITSPTSIADNQWHHVVATFGPAGSGTPGMTLYVDGERVARDAATRTAESYNGFWKIGWDSLAGWPEAPSSSYFKGGLDNVAIYTRVLSAAEVAEHHEAGQ